MLTLQKLWAVQWVWPVIAYVFILYSEIRTNLSYGHPLIPRRPDKRGLTVGILGLYRNSCFMQFLFQRDAGVVNPTDATGIHIRIIYLYLSIKVGYLAEIC